MKNIIKSIPVAITVITLACSSDKETVEKTSGIVDSIPKIDTVTQVEPTAVLSADFEQLLKMFEEKNKLPVTINKKFIEKLESKDLFQRKEIEMLTSNYLNHDLCLETDGAIKHFYLIDSVKKTGTYEDWSNNLDLGQIKNSEACPLFKITSGNTIYLFWLFNYSTVEACPYGWTKSVYVTVINNNTPGETVVFAENSGGGDAPISSEKNITGTINPDQTMSIKVHDELDQDEPFIEVTEALYEAKISEGKIIFSKEEKKPVKKVKKKTNN